LWGEFKERRRKTLHFERVNIVKGEKIIEGHAGKTKSHQQKKNETCKNLPVSWAGVRDC